MPASMIKSPKNSKSTTSKAKALPKTVKSPITVTSKTVMKKSNLKSMKNLKLKTKKSIKSKSNKNHGSETYMYAVSTYPKIYFAGEYDTTLDEDSIRSSDVTMNDDDNIVESDKSSDSSTRAATIITEGTNTNNYSNTTSKLILSSNFDWSSVINKKKQEMIESIREQLQKDSDAKRTVFGKMMRNLTCHCYGNVRTPDVPRDEDLLVYVDMDDLDKLETYTGSDSGSESFNLFVNEVGTTVRELLETSEGATNAFKNLIVLNSKTDDILEKVTVHCCIIEKSGKISFIFGNKQDPTQPVSKETLDALKTAIQSTDSEPLAITKSESSGWSSVNVNPIVMMDLKSNVQEVQRV